MKIPSAKYLKRKAHNRLASGQEPQKVVLYYAGITAALSLLITAIRLVLENQISKTGGLQNIGIRSILSTADSVLPILQTLLLLCLNLGYLAAMLRISRHQYASPKTLKAGTERFWPLLRNRLLQALLYSGIAFGVFYLALGIFMFSPLSWQFMDAATPLVSAGTLQPEQLMNDTALMESLIGTLQPMLLLYLALLIPIYFVFSYRYRLADYILIDQPQYGAMYSLRQSRILMRGNIWNLFKVDLSLWWYYLLMFLATGLLYLDMILAAFGVILPVSATVAFLITSLLYLAANFAITYFLRNQVEVTYALAYTALVPKEENSNSVVLGNIFNT